MKRVTSKKWLVAAGVLVVALTLGVAACSSDDADQAGPVQGQGAPAMGLRADRPQAQAAAQAVGAEGREARQERREARAERRQALLDNLRDDMTPEDQAQYDELVASVQTQQAAMQEARQELADTLKELRALTDKYLAPSGAGED